MTHEQKGEVILLGIFIIFVLIFLISIFLFISDKKHKEDTTKSGELIFLSGVGLIIILVAHWYWS